MQKEGILQSSVNCPGPLVNGSRLHGCGKPMQLKKTNDSKDTYVWRCHKIHKVIRSNGIYTVKDVKLSIRHHSWIVDAKLSLEIILELICLTSLMRAKCGVRSTLCWKIPNISGSIELFAL